MYPVLDALQALGTQNVQVYVQTAGIKNTSFESVTRKDSLTPPDQIWVHGAGP